MIYSSLLVINYSGAEKPLPIKNNKQETYESKVRLYHNQHRTNVYRRDSQRAVTYTVVAKETKYPRHNGR
jgi:hypothetical protein